MLINRQQMVTRGMAIDIDSGRFLCGKNGREIRRGLLVRGASNSNTLYVLYVCFLQLYQECINLQLLAERWSTEDDPSAVAMKSIQTCVGHLGERGCRSDPRQLRLPTLVPTRISSYIQGNNRHFKNLLPLNKENEPKLPHGTNFFNYGSKSISFRNFLYIFFFDTSGDLQLHTLVPALRKFLHTLRKINSLVVQQAVSFVLASDALETSFRCQFETGNAG